MTRYRLTLHCKACGHKWKKTVECKDSNVEDVPNPPCPKCKVKSKKSKHRGLKGIIETGRTPAFNGTSLRVKAIDETARIVMEDGKMSNLMDNTREGDTMAPRLTPRQEAMSQNFWGGKKVARKPLLDSATLSNALQGHFLPSRMGTAPDAYLSGNEILTDIHSHRRKVPTQIIASTDRNELKNLRGKA